MPDWYLVALCVFVLVGGLVALWAFWWWDRRADQRRKPPPPRGTR